MKGELTLEERVIRIQDGLDDCEELIRDYMPLFCKEAGRIVIKGMDYNDKVNFLAFTFYTNIFTYDRNRGVKFLTKALTDMRLRLVNEHRASKAAIRGGQAVHVSSDTPLTNKDTKNYTKATTTLSTGLDTLLAKEILEIVDEATRDWDENVRNIVFDYISSEDSINEVKKRHSHYSISHTTISKRIRFVRQILESKGYKNPKAIANQMNA